MMKMTQTNITWIEGSIVENELQMTIVELSHASRTPEEMIMSWVSEGVLSPSGSRHKTGASVGTRCAEQKPPRISLMI
jgi:hypothetical protein